MLRQTIGWIFALVALFLILYYYVEQLALPGPFFPEQVELWEDYKVGTKEAIYR